MKRFIAVVWLLMLLFVFADAQNVTFSAPPCSGAVGGTWIVPCDVTAITIQVYGAGAGGGGGGGGSNGGFFDTRGGGGGGGGGYTTTTINVTPGSSFAYSAGGGGCGGSNGSDGSDGGNGSNGGNSTFTGTDAGGTGVNLTANGGGSGGGGDGTEGSTGSGGAGGSASGGTTNTSGIAGVSGSGGNGGAGGNGAGPGGGAGGASTSAAGNPYGGGGAGGGNSTGGVGAGGGILITYVTTIPLPATPTITSTPPTCTTAGTSTISNYDPAETYNFTPAGPTAGAGGAISGMVTGTSYTVTAGTGSCASAPSASFSNAATTPPPTVPVVSTTPASCTAAGTATINNYNLSLSYIFTPAGPTAGAGGAISGMTAGTSYTVESTDGSCSSGQSASFSIAAQLPVPVAAISGSLSYCTGGNTTLTASGGTSYFWDDAGNSTTATITVTQGTYTVTVSNSNGCMATAMATVTEIATLPVTITGVLSYCTGGNTTLTASGGIGYMWNDPANSTTPSITVTAGTYVVSAADANGCTGTASATVTEVTAATVTITGTLSYCAGGNTTITASGAVSYLWNDAGNSTTPAVTVTQGTYTVTGTDANSCSATAIATVTENALPTISVSGSLTYCTGGSTTLTANGGTGYVWDNGATTPTVTVTQGTYTVTATDVNGCTGTASATVTESTNLSVTISGVLTYCPGANTTLTASGGTSYTWSNGGTADNVTVTQGTYTVTASDAGCTGTASATVTELPALPVSISGVLTYCPGANTTLTASGGTSYMWSNGGIADNITVTQGTYTVTASDAGCNGTASTVVTEIPVSPVNLGNDVTACEETSVTLDAGSGYTSYVWTSGETSQSITPQTSGTYTVTVLDANNCSASGSIDVAFNSCQEMTVFIPNAFSPDGDGNNDVFQYYLTGVVTAEIKVFNRWGEKVFETNNTSQYWDGTNKGVKCNMGVFVYSIRVLSNTGTAKSYKGSLTLLR